MKELEKTRNLMKVCCAAKTVKRAARHEKGGRNGVEVLRFTFALKTSLVVCMIIFSYTSYDRCRGSSMKC